MPAPQPVNWSNLWTEVEPYTEWPVSNENMVEEAATAWKNAGAAFLAAGAPADDGLDEAWTDEVGQHYKRTIDAVRTDSRLAGEAMTFVGEFAAMYAYSVYWAKHQIERAIDINEWPYFVITLTGDSDTARRFVEDMAAIINQMLDRIAAQVAARGAGGTPQPSLPVIDRAPLGDLTGVLPEWTVPEYASRRAEVGAAREREVAEIVGGTVLGEGGAQGLPLYKYDKPTEIGTDVDVIGPNGEFIAVGGAAKAHDLKGFRDKLILLQRRADDQGVSAHVYLDNYKLPPEVIETAILVLGNDNVHLFW